MQDLPESQRTELFSQLSTLEGAGVPADRALKTIAASSTGQLALRAGQAAIAIGNGHSVAAAGKHVGLFTAFETNLLQAVMHAGSPESVYRRLARYYDRRVQHRRKVKTKLILPVLLLVMAIFISPLPQLVVGEISAEVYLMRTLGVCLLLAFIPYVLKQLPIWLRESRLQGNNAGDWIASLIMHLPLSGSVQVRRNRTQFLQVLCLLLQAGIPVFDAVPLAASTVPDNRIRKDFEAILGRLQSGLSLSDALSQSAYFDGSAVLVTAAGEATGDAGEVICCYAESEYQHLQKFDDEFATWLPRLLYFAVLLLMAWGIVSSMPGPSA
jgi:general secretion pathway protein F